MTVTIHILLLTYISVLGVLFFFKGPSRLKNRWFVLLSFVAIFLIQSLRAPSVGRDTYRYYIGFTAINNSGSWSNMIKNWEPLYLLLNRFVGLFTDNAQWLLVADSLIIDIGISYFIINNTKDDENTFWPVFFWIVFSTYFNSMNTVRQALSLAFVVNMYTVLKKDTSVKGYIKSIILLVIGIMFHRSTWICVIVLVPFIIKQLDRKMIIIAGIIAVAATLFSDQIINLVVRLYPKYSRYLHSDWISGTEVVGNYYIALSVIRLALVALIFTLKTDNEDRAELYRLAFYMVISVAFYLLKTRVTLAGRTAYFFEVFQIIFIPKTLKKVKQSGYMKAALYVFGCVALVYLCTQYYGARGFVPYKFFWEI